MEQRDDEGMGTSDIKYGDSLVYVQHMKTGMWLSYQTYETKKRGVGRVEEKKVRRVGAPSFPEGNSSNFRTYFVRLTLKFPRTRCLVFVFRQW